MITRRSRTELRNRQAEEVEANQAELRKSISETQRLVGETDDMLRRHREESDDADKGTGAS